MFFWLLYMYESTLGTRIPGWLTLKIDMSISGSLGFNFDISDIGNLTRRSYIGHILTNFKFH